MIVANTLQAFLDNQRVKFELIPHSPAGSSMETAERAHVPGRVLAKAVLLEDDGKFSMVVIPSTEHVHLGDLGRTLGHHCGLATETEVEVLFPDCDLGSVPPFGDAYNLDVMVDDHLMGLREVYAESGNCSALIKIDGKDFDRVMAGAAHGRFGHPQKTRHAPPAH